MIRSAAAVAIAAAMVALAPATPATAATAKTVTCKGSIDGKGRYRADKKGLVRDYYARNASCGAARKLLRVLNGDDIDSFRFARGGTLAFRTSVPGGSVWKCRALFSQDGKRVPISRLDPGGAKTIVQTVSCRPLTGRLNRRTTYRTRDIKREFVEEEGAA